MDRTAPVGPFADGPPPALLEVHAPDLRGFGSAELRRVLRIFVTITASTLRSVLGSLRPARSRGRGTRDLAGRRRIAPSWTHAAMEPEIGEEGGRATTTLLADRGAPGPPTPPGPGRTGHGRGNDRGNGRTQVRWRDRLADGAAEGLIDGFIELGPTFVKLGQVLASSAGIFPERISHAARRCLDAVPSFPADQARRVISEDLGAPIEELFATFDDVPLSAASIGQVHACTLLDGRDAVMKVQRPAVGSAMRRDLRVLHGLARLADRTRWGRHANVAGMVADLSSLTAKELNPLREAWNQQRFRDHLDDFGDNEHVTVPEVHWDRCGTRSICMERVRGTPMDDFEDLRSRGVDGELVLRRGAKAWVEAVLVHGPFHGDLHAGNIWVLDDGRGCFLDFGIMGELDETWRQVARDLYFTCVFDRDFTRVARSFRSVGLLPDGLGTDEELGQRLGVLMAPMLEVGTGSVSLGELITSALALMGDTGGTSPQELMLVGKQLLYIERYTQELAPDYSALTDPFLVRNVFPEAAAAYLAAGGTPFPE